MVTIIKETFMRAIQLAVELPPSMFDLEKHTDFDFVIASHCLENPRYLAHYCHEAKGLRKMILDNGAFEKGESIPLDEYLNLVRVLKPNVLVLPDTVGDYASTVRASREFLQNVVPAHTDVFLDVEFMAVLQGSTISEYLLMLDWIAEMGSKVSLIGIPYHLVNRPKFIRKHNVDKWCQEHNKRIHILGLPNPFEVRDLVDIPEVVTVDTSLPVLSAQHGFLFKELRWKSAKLDLSTEVSSFVHSYATDNIQVLRALCDPYARFRLY
jgi:hypothetical protein